MRYQGSEAYQVVSTETRRERRSQERAASFEVVSGGGLDARARRGVSAQFVARVRVAVLVAAVLVALGLVRVSLTAATVSVLSDNETLKAQISDVETSNADLKISRSVLSSNSRITRIATQNLGMVLPESYETVTAAQPGAADASSDAAADAAAAGAAATDAQADGDGVPAADADASQGAME